jgi:CBS domain-containing protein
MSVKQIISNKRMTQIISVKPGDSIATAAQVLAKHKIGAVIVSRDGAIVDGILSERDIVRGLGTTGVGVLSQQVRDIMTAEVIACHPEDTANSVMEKMSDGRFRHMPVVDQGKMVGVISIGDVVKARIDEIQHENTALTEMISNSW